MPKCDFSKVAVPDSHFWEHLFLTLSWRRPISYMISASVMKGLRIFRFSEYSRENICNDYAV